MCDQVLEASEGVPKSVFFSFSVCFFTSLLPLAHYPQDEVIKREINILMHLQGGPNIVKLYDVVQHPETKVRISQLLSSHLCWAVSY